MGNEAAKNYGAKQQSALLLFDPDDLTIIKDKSHPLYDERVDLPLDGALVESIMTHGVINPIIVRKNKETNEIEVVAGRQRVASCIEANKRLEAKNEKKKLISGTICKFTDAIDLSGLVIIDNELRRNDGIYIKALKCQRALSFGATIEQVAKNFGVVIQSINNYLAVLKCSKAVLAALDSGELSADAAKKFASLKNEDQDKLLKEMRSEGALKGKKANKKLEKATGRPSAVLGMGKKQIKGIFENLVEMQKAFPNIEKYEFGMFLVKAILEDTPMPFCPFMSDISLEELEKESLRRFESARNPDAESTDIIYSDVLVGPKTKKKTVKHDSSSGVIDLDGSDDMDQTIDLDSDNDTDSDMDSPDLDTSDLARAIEAEEAAKPRENGRGRPRKAM